MPFVAAGDQSKLGTGGRTNGSAASVPSNCEPKNDGGKDGTSSDTKARPLVDLKSPAELTALTDLSIPTQRFGLDRLVAQIDQVLRYSVNTWDQGFMDKLYSATNPVRLPSFPPRSYHYSPYPSPC